MVNYPQSVPFIYISPQILLPFERETKIFSIKEMGTSSNRCHHSSPYGKIRVKVRDTGREICELFI